jgi:CTD nuclear envelope phosphatase 1
MRLDVVVDAFPAVFYVAKRPYLDVFLRTAALWYNLVIYTASLQKYADPLITSLDPDGLVQRRLFRGSCRRHAGNYVKDLALVEPDLRDVLILDNSPAAYAMHEANAVPVEAWYDDQNDEELLNLLPLLHAVAFLDDVRSLLTLRLTKGTLAPRRNAPPRNPRGQ